MDEIRRIFTEYVRDFGTDQEKISIKVRHTFEVDKVMTELVRRLDIDEHMKYLAHITAIFHDIGRFEQIRTYGTYLDHLSVNHAEFGADIIEEQGLLNLLSQEDRYRVITAVRNHNRYSVEEEHDKDTLLLCHLIRDADKCDIFRIFAEENISAIVGNTLEEIEGQEISDKVFDTFMEHKSILKTDRKNNLDIWVGYLAFFFDMHFDETVKMMKEDGRYRKRFDEAKFQRDETVKAVDSILCELEKYIEERTGANR